MKQSARKMALASSMATIAGGLMVYAGGAAQAVPTDCAATKGIFDATAVCRSGDGNSVLFVDCVGLHLPPGGFIPQLGNYRSEKSNHAPVGTVMHASCLLGIALDTVVVPAQ
jgi:hypothetical protein